MGRGQAYLSGVGKLLLLFTVVPLLELYLLLLLGEHVGFWPTVALVLVTGVLGAALGKREGLRVWRSWTEALARARMPEEGILGGVLVLIGGVLLVTPGVLTDVTGVALLVPPTRRLVAKLVRARLEQRFAGSGQSAFAYRVVEVGASMRGGFGPRVDRATDVIEAEGEVIEERRRRPNG